MEQLRFLDRLIVRSIFHAIRNYVIQLGYYPDVSQYPNPNDPAAILDFKTKIAQIQSDKGFYIDVYSESSARNKGEKKAPRIVISLDREFSGGIGATPSEIVQNPDGTYSQISMPGTTTELVISVWLITHNSEQTYVLNGIKDNVLGEKNYIYLYDSPNQPFYIYRSGSSQNHDDPTENVRERAYLYTVPDLFLGDNRVIRDNISPIKEITVEIENPEDKGFIVK